jgi:hypothetical protein
MEMIFSLFFLQHINPETMTNDYCTNCGASMGARSEHLVLRREHERTMELGVPTWSWSIIAMERLGR